MWSNDYPHPNSSWPHSRDIIERDLSHLPEDVLAKLVREHLPAVQHDAPDAGRVAPESRVGGPVRAERRFAGGKVLAPLRT